MCRIIDISLFHLFILRGFIIISRNDQLPVGSMEQLTEHSCAFSEVMGLNPFKSELILGFLFTFVKQSSHKIITKCHPYSGLSLAFPLFLFDGMPQPLYYPSNFETVLNKCLLIIVTY